MNNRRVDTLDSVELFLNQFFPKMDIWGIIFLNREKNQDALASLGITSKARETII